MNLLKLERRKLGTNGRVFRIWWECPGCRGEVGVHDAYCRHCGEKFESPVEEG